MGKVDRSGQSARAKVAQTRAEQARRHRRRVGAGIAGAIAAVAVAVGVIVAAITGGGSTAQPHLALAPLSALGGLKPAPAPGPPGPEGVPAPSAPPLAGLGTAASGQTVDGIKCQASEQVLFHIHAHLTIFVNGAPRAVPAGVGIPGARAQSTAQGPFIAGGSCFYWLHTHAADGVIHIESPTRRTYTLGDFFDEWGQPLRSSQVGPFTGHVTAIYNHRLYSGNPRSIPLTAHAQIQLEIGTPLIAPETITWPQGL